MTYSRDMNSNEVTKAHTEALEEAFENEIAFDDQEDCDIFGHEFGAVVCIYCGVAEADAAMS